MRSYKTKEREKEKERERENSGRRGQEHNKDKKVLRELMGEAAASAVAS